MKGVRLEVDALVIESSNIQVKNISKCLYQASIEAEDIVLEPLAAAKAVHKKTERAGSCPYRYRRRRYVYCGV